MEHKDEMLTSLHELLSIPSVTCAGSGDTPYGEEPDCALTYMLQLCQRLGFRTKN